MTEDEAKQKWCPFSMTASGEVNGLGGWTLPAHIPSFNRVGTNTAVGKCIGSACMAWRWSDPETDKTWTAKEEPAPGPDWAPIGEAGTSRDARFYQRWERPFPNRAGHCGLAGAPQ